MQLSLYLLCVYWKSTTAQTVVTEAWITKGREKVVSESNTAHKYNKSDQATKHIIGHVRSRAPADPHQTLMASTIRAADTQRETLNSSAGMSLER